MTLPPLLQSFMPTLPGFRYLHALFIRMALLAVAVLLGGCHATLFAGLDATDRRAGIEAHRNIVFDAQHLLKLDVYQPRAATHAPVVVFFYGGSWTHGERAWYRFVGAALAAHGVVTVIPDYRKYPQVKMDGFMQDSAKAVAWVHQHASEFGGSADDMFVMGHSAGGQIGALLLTDPSWLAPYGLHPTDMAGFIGLAGCYDFMPIPSSEQDMLGMFGRDPASQARAQPVRFVSGHEPPMLLLQGQADHEVDPSNAISLAHALKARHEAVTLRLYPGVSHNALVFALSRPLHGEAPTLDDVLLFIRTHPGTSPPPTAGQPDLTAPRHTAIVRHAEVFISLSEWRDEIKREAGWNPALPRSGVWKRPSPQALGLTPGSGEQ